MENSVTELERRLSAIKAEIDSVVREMDKVGNAVIDLPVVFPGGEPFFMLTDAEFDAAIAQRDRECMKRDKKMLELMNVHIALCDKYTEIQNALDTVNKEV